jgi:hypothetical protein
MSIELSELRRLCPLPVLMDRLGYGQFARSSCRSPFRNDTNAPWGIFRTQDDQRCLFKDLATGETGDEIAFLAHIHKLDCKRNFSQLLRIYKEAAQRSPMGLPREVYPSGTAKPKPDTAFLKDGTDEQLLTLSRLRGISTDGLHFARLRGVLKFGWIGDLELFAVKDRFGLLAEIRRLDGLEFPARGGIMGRASKCKSLPHSRKNWPLGIIESVNCESIALVEGMPDFLAMHQFVVEESASQRVAPVAMLTSSCDIASEALPYFNGKRVRIFPHHDTPGIDAVERWHNQLIAARALSVDFFNFYSFDKDLKDLCDYNGYREAAGIQQPLLNY